MHRLHNSAVLTPTTIAENPDPFKVIDFGTIRKRVYIFLLVVNTNLDPILHHFRDTAA